MDSKLISLGNFLQLNEFDRINIPIYQRAYDWKAQHVDQFLNDVEHHIQNPDENSYQFLGMIVYVNKENKKEIEIIDGQQRLTTFYLLASILFDWVNYQNSTDRYPNKLDKIMLKNLATQAERIKYMLYTSESIENHYIPDFKDYELGKSDGFWKTKLYTDNTYKEDKQMTEYLLMDITEVDYIKKTSDDTAQINSNPMNTRFRMFNPVKGEKPIIKGLNLNTSKSRPIVKNHARIQKWLNDSLKRYEKNKEKRFEFLKSLFSVLREKLKIIPFQTSTHNEAFTLFEVLNDRGLQVSQADLLKNLCIKKGKTYSEQKDIYNKWQEVIDETLEENNKIQFLRTSFNSKYNFIRKNELYAAYRKILKDKNYKETYTFIETDLKNDVDNYNYFLLLGDNDLPQSIQKWITLLYHTETAQWRSLALALFRVRANHETDEKIGKTLSLIFEIVFTMIANKTRFNEIENEFPEIATKVEKGKIEKTYNLLKTFRDKKGLSYKDARIDSEDYVKNSFCALIMMMYKSNDAELGQKKYTVEHILPQQPKDKDWSANFPDLFIPNKDKKSEEKISEAKSRSIYTVGNLLLLEDKQNKSLGNLGFDLKIKKMKSMGIIDQINSEKESNIYKINDFNQQAINLRKKEIEEVIKKNFQGIRF